MAGNKDVQVAGSEATALALFLQNARDDALAGNVAGSQYWYKLAAQIGSQGGVHHVYVNA